MSSIQERIMQCLDECNHFDPDNRFVAALDLCKAMLELADKQTIDEAFEKRICSAFIKHLNDKSLDVQTNAVRSIQKTASILKDNNLILIVETLADKVIDPNGTKEVRDVYSLAIRSTVQELNDKAAVKLIKSVNQKFMFGLKLNQDEITEECLDILGEIFAKFPHILIKHVQLVNKDDLVNVISKLLHSKNKSVTKKATQCLGNIAVILNERQLDNLVKDLVNRLQMTKDKDDELTILQSISHITRQVGSKMVGNYAGLVNMLQVYPVRLEDTESIEIDNEIAEASLSSIENLVRRCPFQAKDSVAILYKLVQECIRYDPNYAGDDDDDDDEMNDEEDDGWDDDGYGVEDAQDDDDTAWKVRKSTVKIVDALVQSCPSFLKQHWGKLVELLASRFSERDANVKCDILGAFQELIRASVYQETGDVEEKNTGLPLARQQSSHGPGLQKKLSSTYEMDSKYGLIITNLLKQMASKNDIKVRVAAMKTLSVLSMIMLDDLEKHYARFIPHIKQSANENNNDLITNSLQILHRAFRNTDDFSDASQTAQLHANEIAEFLCAIISLQSQSKIVSDALRVTGNFVRQLVDLDGFDTSFKDQAVMLYQKVFSILQEQNIAQEVKQSSIVAMAKIVTVAHSVLSQQQINQVFSIFGEKLNAELTRESALRAMTMITSNPTDTVNVQGLGQLKDQLVNLLHQAQRSVQLATLETIWTFLTRYQNQLSAAAPDFQSNIAVFIGDNDIQRAQLAIRCSTILLPLCNAAVNAGAIEKSVALCKSSQIQGHAIVQELEGLFKTAVQNKVVDMSIVGAFLQQSSLTARASSKMGAIVVIQSGQAMPTVQQLANELVQGQQAADQYIIERTLLMGEIGAMQDLSQVGNIIELVASMFAHPQDQVRQAAAICLGMISIGNTDFFLDRVFQLIKNSDDTAKFMYMSTIREIITIKPECLQKYIQVLLPLYVSQSGSDQQSIRNIVAESIGKLYIVHPEAMQQDLQNALTGTDVLSKVTCARSFKYSAYKNKNQKSFVGFVPILIHLISAKEVEIKQAALESISQIAANKHLHALLKTDIENLVNAALAETPINKALVETVDLGPFKHTVDHGAPIRKAAFGLLQNVTVVYQFNQAAVVKTTIDGFMDTSEDVQLLCLGFMSKLLQVCPMIVLAQLDKVCEQFHQIYSKMFDDLKKDAQTERQLNLMRGILRVTEALQRNPEAMQNPAFGGWFNTTVLENVEIPAIRELYEKIVSSSAHFAV